MRKNVLIFMHSYGPQFVDVCNQYTRIFDPKEYAVTVIYMSGPPDAETQEHTLAEELIFLNAPKKDVRGLKLATIKKMLEICKKKNYHIVICHRYKPTYIMLWIAKFCTIPHFFSVMHELESLSSYGRRLLIAALAPKHLIFAGVSNALRDDLRRDIWRIPHERVLTFYNVIDIELTEPKLFTREEAREKLNLPKDAFVFGNLGRLVPNKDQKTLIQAFAMIKPELPNAKLIILGEGRLEQKLKQLTHALNVQNDVIFTGFVSEGYRYMKAFDVFVLSSVQETFGRVLLEATVARVPIIATRVHGIPEVLGESGQLVAKSDAQALAQAMLLNYQWTVEVRQQSIEKTYKRIKEQFSLPAFQTYFRSFLA